MIGGLSFLSAVQGWGRLSLPTSLPLPGASEPGVRLQLADMLQVMAQKRTIAPQQPHMRARPCAQSDKSHAPPHHQCARVPDIRGRVASRRSDSDLILILI